MILPLIKNLRVLQRPFLFGQPLLIEEALVANPFSLLFWFFYRAKKNGSSRESAVKDDGVRGRFGSCMEKGKKPARHVGKEGKQELTEDI